MDKDFLLGGATARTLYHEFAAKMPIIDYHCHIDASEILDDRRFGDLTELWLEGDHYKWRLMRDCGVPEDFITGEAPSFEKFAAFAGVLPRAIGNPVYHWAHLELQRFFGIDVPLSPETAEMIWEKASAMLTRDPSLSARGILRRMRVEAVVTTDDPADSLASHKKLAGAYMHCKVLPCFRPDGAMNIDDKGFAAYITKLGGVVGRRIASYNDLTNVMRERISHFKTRGCKAADHGIFALSYAPAPPNEVGRIFAAALRGAPITPAQADKYRFALLQMLAREYARLGWVMELHLGVSRDVNSVMVDKLGAGSGYDCIGTSLNVSELARVLGALNAEGALPKTLIFSIDPNDNAGINTLAACFSGGGALGGGVRNRVQQGSAWWFNDSLGGIYTQLQNFAEYGVLGNFIGMLTDSRSHTSYVRHEYFRRILCSFLGRLVDSRLYPRDMALLAGLVKDICYNNVRDFFGL